ncbi:MAG: hypothetical protein IPL61_37765 [Myxococcales bacterium]|nr:hypothetical protein [Myxococcales bacterium]
MDRHQFTRALQHLLRTEVDDVTPDQRGAIVRQQLGLLDDARGLLEHRVAFVPFVPGRRPSDEILAPGLGSSEAIGLLHGSSRDHVTLLYHLTRAVGRWRPCPTAAR